MKIALINDVHLNFGHMPIPKDTKADILVVAGDLATAQEYWMMKGIDWLQETCKYFDDVIFVPGNHDFYEGEYHKTLVYWRTLCALTPNLHYMHNDVLELNGVRFIGTTLWTPGNDMRMNDFACITRGKRLLHWTDTNEFHKDAVEFLLNMIPTADVVITHHAPIQECVRPKYYNDPINVMFHANLNPIIEDNDIKLWLHGHMHDFIDIEYANTRIVCNPRGYVGYEAKDDYAPFVVEIA